MGSVASPREPLDRGSFFVRTKGDVAEMFRAVHQRYDLLNWVFSLGQDRKWRRRSALRLDLPSGAWVLDVGAGTGEFALAIRRRAAANVVMLDLVPEMLRRAVAKWEEARLGAMLPLVGDGEALPFCDDVFDGVVAGFVGRNVLDLRAAFCEMRRVLKSGGRLGYLEFCRPEGRVVPALTHLYFRSWIPFFGNLLSSRRVGAYTYLVDSIERFHTAGGQTAIAESCGFREVAATTFNLGTVVLVTGRK